jgi:fibronectin-binding autotransporter adhesin
MKFQTCFLFASRFLFALAALLAALSIAKAETLTLAPGATVWDEPSANWLNSGGSLVTYFNSTDTTPVINGPLDLGVALPRVCGSLTLNNGVSLTGGYLLIKAGAEVNGAGAAGSTFGNRLLVFPGGSDALSLKGTLTFNTTIEAGTTNPVIVATGTTTLGPGAALTASAVQVGSASAPFVRLNGGTNSLVSTTGDMTVGDTNGNTGIVVTTGTNFSIGGDWRLAHGGNCNVTVNGGTVGLGGALRLADYTTSSTSLPSAVLTMRNSTLSVADSGGAGIRGTYFNTGGDIGVAPSVNFPGTRISVRTGGFLTVDSRIGFGVNNTIIDTTGGDARIDGRLWGKALIKEGPGILKLTRDNRNGGGGGGVLDGTIVRGGFIEFSESLNLNDGGDFNHSIDNSPSTGLKNIQLNGGGLRWAVGSSVDISARFRVLNNFSFDTNGNNVTFATSLAGTGGMTKTGAGTLTPAATNSYSGGTTVTGGAVQFASLATLGSGNVTLNGGALRWAGGNTVDVSARLQPLGAGGAYFDTNGNNVVLSAAPLTGAGLLVKQGAGTLTLPGSQPWTGGLYVNGGGVTVTGTALNKESLVVGDVGAGVLTVNGTLSTTTLARIGGSAGIAGTVNVNGSLNAGTYWEIGSGGTGTLNVTNGGQVTAATTTALGVLPGSAGTLNVSGLGGAGGTLSATFGTGTICYIAYGGVGTAYINSGGVMNVGGQLRLAELSTASGAFVLNTGGTLNVGGAGGIGTGAGEFGFYLSGGTLKVTGSTLTTTVPMILTNLSGIDTSGVNAVLGGALSGSGGLAKFGGGILYLNAAGTYAGGTQLYGGSIVVPAATSLGTGAVAVLGGSLYSSGTFSRDVAVTVSGAGTSLGAGSYMEIGVGGTGSLAVTNGGQVSTPSSIAFGVLGGGTLGTANVTDAGSALTSGGPLFLGYLGSGSISVGAGGAVTCGGQMILGSQPSGGGLFILNTGGTLNVGGTDGIAKGSGSAAFYFAGGTMKITGSTLTTTVPMTLSNISLVDTSGVACALNGALSGSGNLAKTGAGTLTLGSSGNTFSGGATVFAGVVSASTVSSLGGGPVALSGGTLDLPFVGTASVQTLSFDGTLQFGGTWGSLSSSATNKTARITGTGILNVLGNVQPVAFNTAATAGLGTTSGGGLINLATATGATPSGGTFSGPGVSGGSFNPAAAGFGLQVITYTAGSVSGTFTIGVTGGLTLDAQGGSFAPGNLARPGQGIPFAKDVLPFAPHSIANLSDGNYGNTFSWIGNSANSFAGVNFHTPPMLVNRIAFGRDNTGIFTDRSSDFYIIQYTTAVEPDATTTAWTTLGAVDYRTGGGSGVTNTGLRHVFSFAPVNATGLRILTATFGTAIDEIEVYQPTGLFASGLTVIQEGGSFGPNNLAQASGATAFASDVLPIAPHSIADLNNGSYGDASSWIGNSANSFAGIALGQSRTIDRIAFGRDHTGAFTDRALGRYTVQYTNVASPDASTPDASWTTLGLLDYQTAGGISFSTPSLRHLFSFPAITATGLRLIAPSGAAIDELEIYLGQSQLTLEQPVGTSIASGGVSDIGSAFPNATVLKTFTITNTGTSTFVLYGLASIGTNAAEFTPINLSTDTLQPGESGTFSVLFAPTVSGPGPRTAAVQMASNDPATPSFFLTVNGTSLVPTFNAATNSGLDFNTGNGLVNLASASGASPAGGTFSGTGVSGGNFDPTAVGFGVYTLAYSVNGASSAFTVAVTGGLTLEAEGGSVAPNNLAPTGTAFAKDVFPNNPNHSIAHLNDGLYSNAFSWLGNSANSFAGISLGSTPVAVNRIAFGRDNTGSFTDRAAGFYTVQFTTDPNPTAVTTAWANIGAVFYPAGGNATLPNPALRHVFSFTTVNATGLRLLPVDGAAIDELELYAPSGLFTSGSLALLQEGGSFAPNNLARSPGATPFAKDELGSPHFTTNLNNGSYGNASSWIGNSTPTFAGIALGQSLTIDRIAFSRDNTGTFLDRSLGHYTVQYTNTANPSASTPDASWTTIGQLDYQTATSPISTPARRHLFSFAPVTATAIRITTEGNTGRAIDEIEIYQGQPSITLEQNPSIPLTINVSSVDFGNVAPGAAPTIGFTLRNPGSAALFLQSVSTDSVEYIASAPSTTTIAPGGSSTFTITSNPASYGPRAATLHIVSNDPLIPDFAMLLFSNALTPIEGWRQQKFGSFANTGAVADAADPNHNGISNLIEYALGGEPLATTSESAILPRISIVANHLSLQFTRQPALTDIILTVQASEDLTTWSDIASSTSGNPFTALISGLTLTETPNGAFQSIQLTDPALTTDAAHPKRFLRVQVTR